MNTDTDNQKDLSTQDLYILIEFGITVCSQNICLYNKNLTFKQRGV